MTDHHDELVCARCQPTEAKVTELEGALQSISDENSDLAEELVNSRQTQRTLEKQIATLRADLSKATESSAKSQEIKGILEYWKLKTGHKRAGIQLTGDRAKLVRGQLRHFKAGDLMEAIDGVALKPYMRFGKRYVYGNPKTDLATELEHCVGTSRRVEENRRVWHAAQTHALSHKETLLDVHDHFDALAAAYWQLVLNTVCAREKEQEGDELGAARILAQTVKDEAEMGVVDVVEREVA